MLFRTETIDAPLAEIVRHYRRLCGYRGVRPKLDAVHVACVGAASFDSIAGLASRLIGFAQTGDFAELGGLRYAFARRAGTDSSPKTFLLTMWTEGAVPASLLLPTGGRDAEGQEPPGLPRHRATHRVLSASEVGEPSGIFLYRAPHSSAKELADFYRAALPASGWRLVEQGRSESIVIDGVHMIAAEREDLLVTVLAHRSRAGGAGVTVLSSEQSP